MKKFFYGIICMALTAGFYSCNSTNNSFSILTAAVELVQLGENEFKPVAGFATAYGTLNSTSSYIALDGTKMTGRNYVAGHYETIETYTSLSEVTGTYTFVAVSAEGEQDTRTLNLNLDKKLGVLEFIDFQYDEKTDKLSMVVVGPVENATHYGFYCRPYYQNALLDTWLYNGVIGISAKKEQNEKVEASLGLASTVYDGFMVYPAVFYANNNYRLLTRIDQSKGKLITKESASIN